MLRMSIRRIKPGKEARLREWLAELNRRADEVRATFVDETVRAEQALIIEGPEGALLVSAEEAEDFEHGARAFAASRHAIDLEHRTVMRECLGESIGGAPLYDVAAVRP
jgi:hypothetical protein